MIHVHVHDGGGEGKHADGETYSILILCDAHFMEIASDPQTEFVVESDEGYCDRCDESCAGCITPSVKHPCRAHGCTMRCHKHYTEDATGCSSVYAEALKRSIAAKGST